MYIQNSEKSNSLSHIRDSSLVNEGANYLASFACEGHVTTVHAQFMPINGTAAAVVGVSQEMTQN